MRILMKMPGINKKVYEKICEQVSNAFGGNFYEVIIGGAAFNQEIESFLHRIGFRYTVGYGATECAPIICYADFQNFVPGSCGKEVVHMQVRIQSNDPENEPGEILCKGLNVMLGYYKNEEATRAAIDEDGWFHTGDMAKRNAEGFIYIIGRYKDMIKSGGENIYAAEVEAVFRDHPAVADCALIGKPDPKWDEVGVMVVVLEKGKTATEAELIAFCKERLANYKVPKQVIFADSLPYSAYGKIQKAELKKKYLGI